MNIRTIDSLTTVQFGQYVWVISEGGSPGTGYQVAGRTHDVTKGPGRCEPVANEGKWTDPADSFPQQLESGALVASDDGIVSWGPARGAFSNTNLHDIPYGQVESQHPQLMPNPDFPDPSCASTLYPTDLIDVTYQVYLATKSRTKSDDGMPAAGNRLAGGLRVDVTAHAGSQAPDLVYVTVDNLTGDFTSDTTASISWDAGVKADTAGVVAYRVGRGRSESEARTLAQGFSPAIIGGTPLDPQLGTTFDDTGLTPGVTYYYIVAALIDLGATVDGEWRYVGYQTVGQASSFYTGNLSNTLVLTPSDEPDPDPIIDLSQISYRISTA